MNIISQTKIILHKLISFLMLHIELQLFITLISFPILISWGMPLSLAAAVGNLLFSPLMTIFLGLSTLVFITTLFSIPNRLLIYLLEQVTNYTYQLLSLGSKKWLCAFKKPHWIVGLAIMIGTIAIVSRARRKIPLIRMGVLSCYFLLISLGFTFYKTTGISLPHIIPQTREKLSLVGSPENLNLQDKGLFNIKTTPENYIMYELKPYLSQQFGLSSIKTLTLYKPSIRTFKAAQTLISQLSPTSIIVNKSFQNLSKYAWRLFFDLKRLCEKASISFEVQNI